MPVYQPIVTLDAKTLPPQVHYQLADRYLQRADAIVEGLDERDDWHEDDGTLQCLDVLARLAQAHATLGASR